jgi:CubicO group peptidase (beta-lactamase class C family)
VNAAIDAVVQEAMVNSPVRHAALAIVHKKQLVYTRGYTFAGSRKPIEVVVAASTSYSVGSRR